MALDRVGALHVVKNAPGRFRPLVEEALAVADALTTQIAFYDESEIVRVLAPAARDKGKRDAIEQGRKRFEKIAAKAKEIGEHLAPAWSRLTRAAELNEATFYEIPSNGADAEKMARAQDRENTARLRWAAELPTLDKKELIELANGAADNGELALLRMIQREAARLERKVRDGSTLVSGELQVKVNSAVARARLPFDEAEIEAAERTLQALAGRIDRARALVHAPPDTEQHRDASLTFRGMELAAAVAEFRAAHPGATDADVREHERELRLVRDAEHRGAVEKAVKKFMSGLPSGLNLPPAAA